MVNLRKFAKFAAAVRRCEWMVGWSGADAHGASSCPAPSRVLGAPRRGPAKAVGVGGTLGALAFAAALLGGVGGARAGVLTCGVNSCTFSEQVTNNGTINIPLFLTVNGAPAGQSLTSLTGTITPAETAKTVTVANDNTPPSGSSSPGSLVTGGAITSTGAVQISDSLDVASLLSGSRYSALSGQFIPSNHFSHTFSVSLSPGNSSTYTFTSGTFNFGGAGSYTATNLAQWENSSNGTADPLVVQFLNGTTGNVTSTGGANALQGALNTGTVTASFTYNFAPTQVPEPATIVMLMSGVLGLGAVRFRRSRR